MIHSSKKIASYVYLRNGVYYFQLRLKRNDARHHEFKSGLIRKSLKTSNYREAVNKARLLWFENMTNKKTSIETQDEIEKIAQYDADLYSRGKELYNTYLKLDAGDENVVDEFFAAEFGTSGYSQKFDMEAFEYYSKQQDKNIQVSSFKAQGSRQKSSGKGNVSLQIMIDKFILENQNSASAWDTSQLGKYQKSLEFFCTQMSDCNVCNLTSSNIRNQYVNKLHQLPADAYRQKILHDKNGKLFSTDTVIDLTRKHKLNTQSVSTYRNKAEKVEVFLKFLIEEELTDNKILNAFSKIKKVKKDRKKRIGFNDEQLQSIFNSEEFQKGIWFKKYIWRHWGLLLALYTGARVNEICQLDVADIIKDKSSGIYYINISAGKNKKLKTSNSYREVPVHKTLIELGFLNYVEGQRRKKEKKLFSELKMGHDGTWCRKLKDWFNVTYLRDVGVDKFVSDRHTTLSFHCFRNTVIDCEKQNGLNRAVMEEVVGHEKSVKETVHDSYAVLYNLKNRKREVNKLKFNIDVKKIKKWQ